MANVDTLHVTPQLLALLSELDEFKGAWRALGILAPERLSALRRVATIESIGSSTRIEGSRLTDREVEALLGRLNIKAFATRDEQEVAGYAEVMETVFQSWADIPLTERHLKQLHRDLLRYSEKDERHRGEYKTLRNDVAAFDSDGKMIGIVFETATPFDTPRKMSELLAWLEDVRANNRRGVHSRVSGYSSISGWKWPAEPDSDNTAAAPSRLCVCAVQFPGERDREQQRRLLPSAASDAEHAEQQHTRLAAMAAVFPSGVAAAETSSCHQGRAREIRHHVDRSGRENS
jgi:hypothetical protein